MEPLRELLNAIRHHGVARGNFLGLLHVLVGRRITRADGTPVSGGMTWRELSLLFKQLRWDRDAVRELNLDPADLPPRDRERFWYAAIAQAGLAGAAAKAAGDRLVAPLQALGYVVGPAPGGAPSPFALAAVLARRLFLKAFGTRTPRSYHVDMKPCISEAATLPGTFAADVEAFAEGGCHALEVWLTKLETHLETHSVADTRKLLEDHQTTLAAAAYQGGLLLSQGEQRRAHYDHFKRRLDLCQTFGIPTLLVVADFVGKVGATDLERAVVSLKQAGQWAAAFDVRLALEFRSAATFCSSLDTALALVAACGEPNVGVNLDLFHYYTGPSKFDDLSLLTRDNLAFVQVCDLAGVPRELAADTDRILPGEGDFRLRPIMERLRAIGYDGYVSLELLNPVLWRAPAVQVADLGMKALGRLLGDIALDQG